MARQLRIEFEGAFYYITYVVTGGSNGRSDED